MFTVRWTGPAFDQMGQIIRNNPAREEELAEALREISARLGSLADTAGESRGTTLRVMFAGPLTVYFRPDPDTSTVDVIRVRARFTA